MAFKSIKSKILSYTSLIVLLGGLVTAMSIAWISYSQEIKKVNEELILKNSLLSQNINIYFEESSSLGKALAKNETIIKILEEDIFNNHEIFLEYDKEFVNHESLEILVSETLKSYRLKKEYEDIVVADTFGEIYLSKDPERIHQNISHSPYFKRSINGYSAFNALYNQENNKTFYYIAEPVKNKNNQIIGVVIIEMRPEKINTILNSYLKDNQKAYLSDENGIIVCSADLENLYTSFGTLNPSIISKISEEQRYVGKELAHFNYQEIQNLLSIGLSDTQNKKVLANNKQYIFTISPIGNTGFFNVLQTDLETEIISAIRQGATTFIPTILTILIIIIFLYFIISSFLEPIKKLKNTASTIGQGIFNIEKKINTNDELDELESVLLHTANQLKSAYLEMENKVKERTKEIEKKNEQAEKSNQAILNIMEDIEKEKNNVEILNQDLKKFKIALDNSSEQVLIADKNRRLLYANQGLKNISGYDPKESIGKTTAELWRIVEDEEKEKEMWNTVLKKKKSYTGEFKCKHKDGHEYFVHKTISPILDEDNKVSFIISIAYDKTKEKEVDRAKTEFVSLASHQLRTPLSSINWYAEMLLAGDAGKLNDDQNSFVEEIAKGNKRMVDLVNSLLDVSRLELGTFSVEPEEMQVCDSAKSIIKELKPDIKKKQMTLKFNCEKNIPKINADPKLVRIIFQNILSNAVKYTPEKGIINMDIKVEDKYIVIKIKDNGLGIPKNQQKKIFEKLFRADNVKSSDTEGTGLGLYLVKSIVDSSGGSIEFESEENKGTTFTVNLPLSGMKERKGSKKLGE